MHKIINVGTDHALLEIDLALNKNVYSTGIDISDSSVSKAKKNVFIILLFPISHNHSL